MTTINQEMINNLNELDVKELPKEGFLNTNRNMLGGLLGAAVSVGLEVISPTGSKVSATVAAAASLGTLYAGRKIAEAAPQSNITAAAIGGVTCYTGMVAGRIAACYFPGNLEE